MDIKQVIKEKCSGLDKVMEGYALVGDADIDEMVLHPIKAGGKRIRPALTILACEAVGGSADAAMPAAASVELLHTFTLVHDDIMDKDDERRGKPTVHSLWGDDMGILIGDALYSAAFAALADLRRRGIDDTRSMDAIETLIEANDKVHQGQIKDMLFEGKDQVSEDEYLDMIAKKTGALIEASVKIGCIAGGGSPDQIKGFKTYGINCGLAFQIKDDILDLIADQQDLGKPVGSDIKSGKKTIMVLHALGSGSGEPMERLKRALGKESATDEEVSDAIRALDEMGSIGYAQDMLTKLIDGAKSSLDIVEDNEAKSHLLAVADYILMRKR